MNEGFRIENDKQAEWALGKIREAKAELEKWEAFYTGKLEAARLDAQDTIDYMTSLLQQYFSTQERRVTKTGIQKYSLPSGELVLKPGTLDYKRDKAALLAWCDTHMPEAVKVTREPVWSDVKARIMETGELPDGVEAYMTEPTFQIKEAK